MSVHNAGRFLAKAVASVRDQTFSDFEFIIIDDGSTDGSGELLERFAAADERIRLVRRENRGLTASLNEGVSLARAALIARMDADDVSLPQRFERQMAFLERHPDVVAVGTSCLAMDEDDDQICPYPAELDHERIDQVNLRHGGGIAHPTAMIRRDALLAIGGYDERFHVAQDMDLFLRLGERGRLANLPDILLHYRLHDTAASARRLGEQAEAAREAVRLAWSRRGLPAPVRYFHGLEIGDRTRPQLRREWARAAVIAG